MEYVFGIDVGGTTVKIGLFTTDGTLVNKWEIPTNTSNGGKAILPDVAASLEEKMKGIMGTKVIINRKKNNKGKIEIEYYSRDELERIIELFETIG